MNLSVQFSNVRALILGRFQMGAGVVTTFGIRVICAALSYLMFIAIGRASSAIDFRDFAFVFTVVGFCGPLAALGSQQTVFKYLPMLIHNEDAEQFAFSRHVFKIVCRGILLFALVACVLIDHGVTQKLGWPFYVVIVLTIATGALAEIMSSFYTVMGSVVVSVFVREMLWRVVLIAGVLALYFINGPVTLMELSLVFLLSYIGMLTAFSVKLGGWLGKVWHAARTITMEIPRRQFWSFFGLAVLGLAIIHLDTMILGLAQQSTSLGAFFSAQRTTQVLLFFGQSIGIFAGPIVSKAYALGNHEEITRFSRRTILFAGAPTLLMAVAMAVLAAPIMGMFRPEFTQYSLMLQILLLAPVFLVLGGLHTIIPTYCGGEHVYLSWRVILMVIMIPIKIAAALWGGPLQFAMVTVLDSLLITIMGLVISRVKCRVSAL
ncbi:hypothetical protein BH10PSE12_BH10PSE12_05050 [soil metagenome]